MISKKESINKGRHCRIACPRMSLSGISGMTALSNNGFTLIELLVVVLIIGILAAIALPKYQVAVEKSRMAEPIQMLRQMYRACKLYELSGKYCTDFWEDADFDWPSETTTQNCYDTFCINTKDWQYVDDTGGVLYAVPQKHWENPPYRLLIYASTPEFHDDKIYCDNGTDTTFCQKICGSHYCAIN